MQNRKIRNNQSVQYSLHAKTIFNISIVGKKSVGKTALIHRQIKDKFGSLSTISQGFQFYSKTYKRKNQQISIQVWDTAGTSQYNSMTRNFFRQAAAIILVYDDIQGLFSQIQQLKEELNEYAHQSVKICLVRSKIDLKPISQQQRAKLQNILKQDSQKRIFYNGEVSSKSNQNVHKYFSQLIQKMYKCYQQDQSFRQAVNPQKDSFLLKSIAKNEQSFKKKKKCC